uniref:Uncharacterized protein n=1 Tax=Arundo donax TaxID=35708 RepID=A0A0A9AMH9_ARUDO
MLLMSIVGYRLGPLRNNRHTAGNFMQV